MGKKLEFFTLASSSYPWRCHPLLRKIFFFFFVMEDNVLSKYTKKTQFPSIHLCVKEQTSMSLV